MKPTNILLSVNILCFLQLTVQTFELQKIEGIEMNVKMIEFDNNSNCYVVAHSHNGDYFYKMNDKKEITFKQKFANVKTVIVNRKNNVYVFEETLDPHIAMWFMRENSTKLVKIFQWHIHNLGEFRLFLDHDDYLFFSTDKGIEFLKPDENIPIAHRDLKNYKFDYSVIDAHGNIYLKVEEMKKTDMMMMHQPGMEAKADFVIKISALEKKDHRFPTAKIVYGMQDGIASSEVQSIGTYLDGNIYFAVRNKTSTTDIVSIPDRQEVIHDGSNYLNHGWMNNYYPNREWLLLSQYETSYQFLLATKNRLYLTRVISEKHFNIYFITPQYTFYEAGKGYFYNNYDTVVTINEMFDFPLIKNDENMWTSDSNGNVFFVHDSQIIKIKYDEIEATKLTTPHNFKISSIAVDQNDDLWVLAGNLFYFKNGTEDAVLSANNLFGNEKSSVKVNRKSEEIYLMIENYGLSVFSTKGGTVFSSES